MTPILFMLVCLLTLCKRNTVFTYKLIFFNPFILRYLQNKSRKGVNFENFVCKIKIHNTNNLTLRWR